MFFMKLFLPFLVLLLTALSGMGRVSIDHAAFGKSLGGWKKRDKGPAEYALSGATYRTYKPEISPTPDGGIFISIRIDHVRGWLSSDDHAVLEMTVNSKGAIVSAQSNIAIQGRSISSDVIFGANEAGKALAAPDLAVQIGTDLVADLSAKLLREKIVEAGRVSFPAVLRHNYNKLFQSIRVKEPEPKPEPMPEASPGAAEAPAALPVPSPSPDSVPLQIKPYATPTGMGGGAKD
jgi:hypothetical protein